MSDISPLDLLGLVALPEARLLIDFRNWYADTRQHYSLRGQRLAGLLESCGVARRH